MIIVLTFEVRETAIGSDMSHQQNTDMTNFSFGCLCLPLEVPRVHKLDKNEVRRHLSRAFRKTF